MPLRVGIVGYGEIARAHERALAAAGAHVVGAVTSRPLGPDLQRFASLGEMIPSVDALTIAVPNPLPAPLCLEAVHAGLAVFVEKPVCITRRELDALTASLPGSGVPVRVGFRLRWNPSLRALRDRLSAVRR